MNKEKVIAIALIILVTLIVSIIVIVKDRTSNEELDTSLFNVKSISEVNELMKENKSYFIYIVNEKKNTIQSRLSWYVSILR